MPKLDCTKRSAKINLLDKASRTKWEFADAVDCDSTLNVDGAATLATGATITTGGLTVSAGGLTVSAGGATIAGTTGITGTTTVTGALATSGASGTITSAQALTVSAGGAGITGNSTIAGSLGLTGASGNLTAAQAITATAGAITATNGNIVATAGNVSAGGSVTAGNGFTVTTGTVTLPAGSIETADLAAGAATLPKVTFTGLKLLAADGVDATSGNQNVTLTGAAVGDRVFAIFGHTKANTGTHDFLVPTIGTHFEATISVINQIVELQAAGNLAANSYIFLLAPATA
jgi:hypothetical protein